jgi:hypothetical protein
MHPDIVEYHDAQKPTHKVVCELLASEIDRHLP